VLGARPTLAGERDDLCAFLVVLINILHHRKIGVRDSRAWTWKAHGKCAQEVCKVHKKLTSSRSLKAPFLLLPPPLPRRRFCVAAGCVAGDEPPPNPPLLT
jgi:hypothetical protein